MTIAQLAAVVEAAGKTKELASATSREELVQLCSQVLASEAAQARASAKLGTMPRTLGGGVQTTSLAVLTPRAVSARQAKTNQKDYNAQPARRPASATTTTASTTTAQRRVGHDVANFRLCPNVKATRRTAYSAALEESTRARLTSGLGLDLAAPPSFPATVTAKSPRGRHKYRGRTVHIPTRLPGNESPRVLNAGKPPSPSPKSPDEPKVMSPPPRKAIKVGDVDVPTRLEAQRTAREIVMNMSMSLSLLRQFTDTSKCWLSLVADVAACVDNGSFGLPCPTSRPRDTVRVVVVLPGHDALWGDVMAALEYASREGGPGDKELKSIRSQEIRYDSSTREYEVGIDDAFAPRLAAQSETRFVIPALSCAGFSEGETAMIISQACRIADAVLVPFGRPAETKPSALYRPTGIKGSQSQVHAWPMGMRNKNPLNLLSHILAIVEADDIDVPIVAVARQIENLSDLKAATDASNLDADVWPASTEVKHSNMRWIFANILTIDGDVPCAGESRDRLNLYAYLRRQTRYIDATSLASRARGIASRLLISNIFLYPELAVLSCGLTFPPRAAVDDMRRGATSATMLHAASLAKHASAVTALLNRGADVNEVDDFERTAVSYAAESGCAVVVSRLLDAGADAMRPSRLGQPKEIVYEEGHTDRDADTTNDTAFTLSAVKRSATDVDEERRRLGIPSPPPADHPLREPTPPGEDDNATPKHEHHLLKGHELYDKSPIHYAVAHHGRASALRALLRTRDGIDVFAQDSYGMTALHYAILLNRVDAVKTLLWATFDPSLGPNAAPWGARGGERGRDMREILIAEGARVAKLPHITGNSSILEVAAEMLLVQAQDGTTPAAIAAGLSNQSVISLIEKVVVKLRRPAPLLARRVLQEGYHCTRIPGAAWLETGLHGAGVKEAEEWDAEAIGVGGESIGNPGWLGLSGEVSEASLRCIQQSRVEAPGLLPARLR